VRARLLVFYAAARLYRNQALPGEVQRQQISSYGVGLRAGYGKRVRLRLDLGVVDQGGGVMEPGSTMLNASVVGYF
jgi:hemolysin activation/secretion protein